jgi:hypothetical protein
MKVPMFSKVTSLPPSATVSPIPAGQTPIVSASEPAAYI